MNAPIIIPPSPLKVLGESALASLLVAGGVAVLIVFVGFLAHPWLLYHAWTILAWTVAGLACVCVAAMLATLIWHLPRIEINSEGFATVGAAGRRFRRWSEIEGDFSTARFFLRPVVVWRLNNEAKKTILIQNQIALSGHDEAIMFSSELSLRPAELAKLLNQSKQDSQVPSSPESPCPIPT
jgi:hypothetical protein